jgi:hypothetical protein
MTMDYPRGPFDDMMAGLTGNAGQPRKPTYTVGSGGRIQRMSASLGGMGSMVDTKIVQVAACLKGRPDLNLFDPQTIATCAFEAVEHYAALPKVRKLFLTPYEANGGKGKDLPPSHLCRILAGVENLLLEIYEDLPYDGSIITDETVENKIEALLKAA